MFTKIASQKKTPDAGKNLRVLQIFRCVQQKLTLQPFFFRKKTHGSGILLAGQEKNVRAWAVDRHKKTPDAGKKQRVRQISL
jgi:hypothetical protein